MADPFSAVLKTLSRRDSTSLLIALLLGYSLVAMGVAATVSDVLRWLAAGTGVSAFVTGLLAFCYSFIFARDRLLSEERFRWTWYSPGSGARTWMTYSVVQQSDCCL